MSLDGFQTNVATTAGRELAVDNDGTYDWPYAKLAFGADGTFTRLSSANPLPTSCLGVTLNDSATDLGKKIGTAVTTNDLGPGLLFRRKDVAASFGTDGAWAPGRVDEYGNVCITGSITVSNAITGIQDNTASNFTLGTTQGVASFFFVDDTSPASATEGTASIARMTATRKQIIQPYEAEANLWSYAAASGGLVNTTGVTAKAAAGAGLRNYVTSVDVTNSHATQGTDVQIRDGASGTVLHRGYAAPGGGGYSINFATPLKGTANTLIEIAEGTATGTNGVYVNLRGYVGA